MFYCLSLDFMVFYNYFAIEYNRLIVRFSP